MGQRGFVNIRLIDLRFDVRRPLSSFLCLLSLSFVSCLLPIAHCPLPIESRGPSSVVGGLLPPSSVVCGLWSVVVSMISFTLQQIISIC